MGETVGLDEHGTSKLYPDKPGGPKWHSAWHNGTARWLTRVERDPCDRSGLFMLRGADRYLYIDGQGTAWLGGSSPRMYVYEEGVATWHDVEITFYGKRVWEPDTKAPRGFVAAARSEHQDAGDDVCKGTGYYGRLLYDGRVDFLKELAHLGGDDGYTDPRPAEDPVSWPAGNGISRDVWVGYKFVAYNAADGSGVALELYRDMTDGADGGDWELVAETVDSGGWAVHGLGGCAPPNDTILTQPATPPVFVRNTEIYLAAYKKFSVREIVAPT